MISIRNRWNVISIELVHRQTKMPYMCSSRVAVSLSVRATKFQFRQLQVCSSLDLIHNDLCQVPNHLCTLLYRHDDERRICQVGHYRTIIGTNSTSRSVCQWQYARGMKITTMTREESTEYPIAVVREAIVNAITHRNYSIRGEGIRVLIFSDIAHI